MQRVLTLEHGIMECGEKVNTLEPAENSVPAELSRIDQSPFFLDLNAAQRDGAVIVIVGTL
jgi:hypothetical protein